MHCSVTDILQKCMMLPFNLKMFRGNLLSIVKYISTDLHILINPKKLPVKRLKNKVGYL